MDRSFFRTFLKALSPATTAETTIPMVTNDSTNFHVQPEQARQTLAAALRAWLPKNSWSEVQRLVRTRHVMIDGNLCLDSGRRVKAGEVVKLLKHPAAPLPKESDVRIRYKDEHLLVVEKPAGMTSTRHRAEVNWPQRRKQIQPTLEELLPRVLGRIGGKGRSASGKRRDGSTNRQKLPPVRAVHRLDRDTSGLMIFARTHRAERLLGEQFRRHSVRRVYLAVIPGHLDAQTIETILVRDRGDGRRGSTENEGVGKRAVTHLRPVERLGDYSMIECRLETGRTHQIRIHLAELGHPLCGEKVYNRPRFGPVHADESGAPRIALHAAELALEHPVTHQSLQFQMPWPADLAAFLGRLRREST